MTRYRMYGLVAECEWPLPECLPAADAPADIRIYRAEVPAAGIDPDSDDAQEQAFDGGFWLNI